MWISCEGVLINLAAIVSVTAEGTTVTLRPPSGPDIVWTYGTPGAAQEALYNLLDMVSVQRIDA